MNIPEYFQTLDQNAAELFALLDTCIEKEINYSEENSWSILQNLEHILLTERSVIQLLAHTIEKKSEKEELFGAEKLIKIIVKLRARQVKAPDFLQPKGEITSVEQFSKEYTLNRDQLKKRILSAEILIDSSVYPHPYLGEMTRRDWLHFIPAHTKRHMHQIADLLVKIRM
jgi:hypothetical protein